MGLRRIDISFGYAEKACSNGIPKDDGDLALNSFKPCRGDVLIGEYRSLNLRTKSCQKSIIIYPI